MRNNSFTRMLLPAALTLVLASTAFAAPPEKESPPDKETSAQPGTPPMPPQSEPAAQTAQTGGKMSETDRMKSEFNARDANMDGYLDKKEAAVDKNLMAQFSTLDANRDGKLSVTEFMNAKNIAALPLPKSDTTRQ